jgi:hypothetical protein
MTTASSRHIDLRNLPANGYVDGVYSLLNPQIGTTRAGKPYLKCLLRDATGEAPARQWTFEESMMPELESTGFVWIAGHTQMYNGQAQIILEQIKPVDIHSRLQTRQRHASRPAADIQHRRRKVVRQPATGDPSVVRQAAGVCREHQVGALEAMPLGLSQIKAPEGIAVGN